MMRQNPIPLLRDLVPGEVVSRCFGCGELVLLRERCTDEGEAAFCPSRAKVEEPKIVVTQLRGPINYKYEPPKLFVV